MTKLETERLVLRPFVVTDAEAMYRNWESDPEVMRFMGIEACNDMDEIHGRISNWMNYFHELGDSAWCVFAIELKSDGEVIGAIDFAETNHEARSAEIGYRIGKAWWGKGYITEALKAVISYCFGVVGLNRLWANYDPRNPASGKVMLKAGMLYEGTARQCKIRGGELVDRIYYAILKEDWDIQNEIARYNSLPCEFNGFVNVPTLTDGDIYLVCLEK